MSQAAVSDITNSMADALNAFTFWVGDSLFAINLDNVLSVEQDNSAIQPDPFQGRGALGIVKHHGAPVRVFDFAEFLGINSCSDQKEALVSTLIAREQDHIDWLNALETSIKTDEPFTRERDPNLCAFGKWYDHFETRDEDLTEIMQQFDVPHKRIHALADRLLNLKNKGQADRALEELGLERTTTLVELRRLFDRARGQIRDSIRSVLLFVTIDGKAPRVALRLNEISDMVSFTLEQITSTTSLGVGDGERLASVLKGYLSAGSDKDCLLIDVDGLLETVLTAS
ncbi:hypothetical protein MNBD_GAMMA15-1403 [hydrothermal vent metagenome]|uniref:Chemoreceptor zinc-binding domain-containing protein n=1 Tax=hydrothermal vent metagenome TaxID=652676 RepID=A0A3B0YYL1_9ZZZZ